ncbi:MAG: hypothetical protein K2W78_08410 [Xanthobacteraceae bacterium]|nr:hypothetical protein [Xanthobacteraceae bacterium]
MKTLIHVLVMLLPLAALAKPAAAADYAPINCSIASAESDKTVCNNYVLGQMEARTATLFEVVTSLVAMGQRGAIQDDQRAFIDLRNKCKSDVACLRDVYAARINQLENALDDVRSRGPF